MASTKDIIYGHFRRFHERNIENILDDYAEDAILFTAAGPLKGRGEIRTLFEAMFAEFEKPGASTTRIKETVEGEYFYLIWSAETADNFYEMATDTFAVRNGKIQMQSFTAKITPKHLSRSS